MVVVRAPDEFTDLTNARHERGTLRWGRGIDEHPVHEGDELEPHETVAWIDIGDSIDGVVMGVGVESFGRVVRLLVDDGAVVVPGQPLMEFDERGQTMAEFDRETERASRAEQRARDVEAHGPVRAVWDAVRRR